MLSFIFYGSLMDSKQLLLVTGLMPCDTKEGHVRGTLYCVTDPTEPNRIFSYPILTLSSDSPQIPAVYVTFDIGAGEATILLMKLEEYEGPFYALAETDFVSCEGETLRGSIFIARAEAVLQDPRVTRALPTKPGGKIPRS